MRRPTAGAVALVLAVPALTTFDVSAEPPATTKTQMDYVVVPHPDDELQGWALVDQAVNSYPVFIVLTRGEDSSYCAGGGLQAEHGEVAPDPQPFGAAGSERCKEHRVHSLHASLDEFADIDPSLDRAPLVGRFPAGSGAPSRYELHVGSQSARVVFDLGDGELLGPGNSHASTVAAIEFVRSLRGTPLPDLAEDAVIGAAYYNVDHVGSVAYDNADHRAVHDALRDHDFGTPGPQLARTPSSDPDASVTEQMSTSTYASAMALGPGPDYQRQGIYQRIYGWLAFDGPNGAWPLADVDTDGTGVFSRTQSFWSRH